MQRPSFACCALLLALLGTPTFADERPGDPGTNVEMPFLIAPLVVDGKLFSYAYISTKVVTTSREAALEVRGKIPFIQDAFVRSVNSIPISLPADPKSVDKEALVARLAVNVKRIVGVAKIARVVVIKIQVSPVHPIETPSQSAFPAPPG